MKYIEAPTVYEPNSEDVAVFLGGGITGAPDWQAQAVEKLSGVEDLALLNPRRKGFDTRDPAMEEQQIKWEFEHLRKADAILFWFPKEAPCAITLFELGYWLPSGKLLFVGVEPGYRRESDVRIQTKLAKAGRLKIFNSLDELVQQVRLFATE